MFNKNRCYFCVKDFIVFGKMYKIQNNDNGFVLIEATSKQTGNIMFAKIIISKRNVCNVYYFSFLWVKSKISFTVKETCSLWLNCS